MSHPIATREDIELIGARLRRAIPLPEWEIFERLLKAIDQIDERASNTGLNDLIAPRSHG